MLLNLLAKAMLKLAEILERRELMRVDHYYLRIAAPDAKLYRKQSGVIYAENGRPMKILFFEGGCIIAFKVPPSAYWDNGGKNYCSPQTIVALIGDMDKEGWRPAWQLARWENTRPRR